MKIRDWFEGLEPRERLLVSAGAVFLVLFFVYVLLWAPFAERHARLRETVERQQADLAWMRGAAAQVQALRRSVPGGGRGLGGRSLLSVVDQSARAGGLGSGIKRIEPDGSRGVKIWLENVSFDQMILWLGKLSRQYQVEVASVSIEPRGPGRVNARLSLLDPGL